MFKVQHFEKLENINKIDLFIGASGFENRATFQANKFRSIIKNGLVICFDHYKNSKNRIKNDTRYKQLGFEFYLAEEHENETLFLNKISLAVEKVISENDDPVIYLDYSSMSRNWYSYIIYSIFHIDKKNKAKILFGYSHAEHVNEKPDQSPNRIVEPLYGYCNFGIPTKPTSLVIGLGNEPNKVFGLKEYFDAIPYIFHTDQSYNSNYYTEAKQILKTILTQVAEKNVYEYPIMDLEYTYFLMDNLCTQLIKENRVILAPCGPKPFTLLCLLLALKHEDMLEVWRISAGKEIPMNDRKPTGEITILELIFPD
ncbi:hypothetical protein JM79_2367 [Gramella sp. Hel_I_59]|uniref:hypothetical protein n=1 Tax=Gramella sp. Hel_I_59 TaxID=1249978 RepID=UPI00115126F4|nr:hypothetical protein [Gramella sp. Hel_I_59]TQI71434.1 hypothetical protein JM79_2367 [Gramella sp. Hel_I_59]